MSGCSSAMHSYESYSDWDSDGNLSISRTEFIQAYLSQDFFERWGQGSRSISYNQLFDEAFSSIDSDNDGKLSMVEFNSQIGLYHFGIFDGSFSGWDEDSNASISRPEFDNHVATSKLAGLWDTDANTRIADREMAAGMFYICDSNGNGSVDEIELNVWKRNRD